MGFSVDWAVFEASLIASECTEPHTTFTAVVVVGHLPGLKGLGLLFISCLMLLFLFLLQVSSKDEDFLDLSVDVEQNTSITHCLR